MEDSINQWNKDLFTASPEAVLSFFGRTFPGQVAFSTSLGVEDQVITEMISRMDSPIHVFTLDTGRLFQETYDLIEITREKYQQEIMIYFPANEEVERMVTKHGINLFFKSIENRKLCCHIRKVEPLKRALNGMKVWITGVRREQSVTRTGMQLVEWDDSNLMIKVNPLLNWTHEQVWNFIREHNVPYNTLHDKGFESIGCQPCTRAILPGEPPRAGRWWWENPDTRECGLHQK